MSGRNKQESPLAGVILQPSEQKRCYSNLASIQEARYSVQYPPVSDFGLERAEGERPASARISRPRPSSRGRSFSDAAKRDWFPILEEGEEGSKLGKRQFDSEGEELIEQSEGADDPVKAKRLTILRKLSYPLRRRSSSLSKGRKSNELLRRSEGNVKKDVAIENEATQDEEEPEKDSKSREEKKERKRAIKAARKEEKKLKKLKKREEKALRNDTEEEKEKEKDEEGGEPRTDVPSPRGGGSNSPRKPSSLGRASNFLLYTVRSKAKKRAASDSRMYDMKKGGGAAFSPGIRRKDKNEDRDKDQLEEKSELGEDDKKHRKKMKKAKKKEKRKKNKLKTKSAEAVRTYDMLDAEERYGGTGRIER